VLYLVRLDRNGWGNAFYAAAAQSGSRSWTAFFFGSSDLGNAITVDKPPASIWVMDLSVRLFGLSSWSLLVPQALMGVAAVALLAATVRRAVGPWPGLLAGLLLAVTPVVTLMFRFDNPDALLTLLVVAAAYTTTRALDDGRLRWIIATGALLGLAFLAKSMQAFLVLPALAVVLLVAGRGDLRRRLLQLAAGGAALAVSAGWWLVAVALVPAAHRPWVGGSTDDSPLGLALGYNGLGRLLGQRSPGGHALRSTNSVLRLFGSAGDQVGWLLPAAVIALIAGLVLVRGAPRDDRARAALLLWGGWAVVTAVVLSTMQGISHSYYTVELAPAVAALVAVGGTLLWRRGTVRGLLVLTATTALTTAWSTSLVDRRLSGGSLLPVAVAATGVVATVALLAGALARRPDGDAHHDALRRTAAAVTVLAAVIGPFGWSLATVARGHHGSSVIAGPLPSTSPSIADPSLPVSPAAFRLLRDDTDDWTWTAAVIGPRAYALQLDTGDAVLPVGGFGGGDPAPTLAAFRADVARHRVHWFVPGRTGTGASRQIDRWVRSHARAVRCGRTTLYDLGALSRLHPVDDDDLT
jgi:4-amino-4-deoxy-L-arabinose transferase-like glycosyltransferase